MYVGIGRRVLPGRLGLPAQGGVAGSHPCPSLPTYGRRISQTAPPMHPESTRTAGRTCPCARPGRWLRPQGKAPSMSQSNRPFPSGPGGMGGGGREPITRAWAELLQRPVLSRNTTPSHRRKTSPAGAGWKAINPICHRTAHRTARSTGFAALAASRSSLHYRRCQPRAG